MSESRVPAAAVAALAIISGSSAANATTTVSIPLSQVLGNNGTFSGSFDISGLLTQGTAHYEVTSGTLQVQGYSDYGTTNYAFAGYYQVPYTAYGSYSYSCGWWGGETCTYYYSYTAYYTAASYAAVDGVVDTLTINSGTDTGSGSDSGSGYPVSYYGPLVAALNLGTGSIADANSTGALNFGGSASTNNDIRLTGATLTLDLRPVVSETPIGDVPEPATWAMMLVGFGAIGATLRRDRRRASRVSLG